MSGLGGILAILVVTSSWLSATEASPPTCTEVVLELSPCISYLTKYESRPPAACCDGVKSLSKYSKRKSDRGALCRCLVNAVQTYPAIDLSLASSLTKKCRVNVKLPRISLDVDCSKV